MMKIQFSRIFLFSDFSTLWFPLTVLEWVCWVNVASCARIRVMVYDIRHNVSLLLLLLGLHWLYNWEAATSYVRHSDDLVRSFPVRHLTPGLQASVNHVVITFNAERSRLTQYLTRRRQHTHSFSLTHSL